MSSSGHDTAWGGMTARVSAIDSIGLGVLRRQSCQSQFAAVLQKTEEQTRQKKNAATGKKPKQDGPFRGAWQRQSQQDVRTRTNAFCPHHGRICGFPPLCSVSVSTMKLSITVPKYCYFAPILVFYYYFGISRQFLCYIIYFAPYFVLNCFAPFLVVGRHPAVSVVCTC